jgi:hypothetical protein
MSNYVGPETMFMLSLKPDQREFVTDTVEEAVKMRSEGLDEKDIESQLKQAIQMIEGWTTTPRIVRRIVLGIYGSN